MKNGSRKTRSSKSGKLGERRKTEGSISRTLGEKSQLIVGTGPRDRDSIEKSQKLIQVRIGSSQNDEIQKKIHWQKTKNQSICGVNGASIFTTNPEEITCKRCKKKVE